MDFCLQGESALPTPIVQGSTVVNVVKYMVWHEIRCAKKNCVYSKTDRNKSGFKDVYNPDASL